MRKFLCSTLFVTLSALIGTSAAAPAASATPPATSFAEAPTYAFLSLIGDQLDIIVSRQQIGTLLDKNSREPPLLIQDPVFDNVAATVAGEAVRKVIPRAELAILNSRSPVLFEKYYELFAEKGDVIAIPDAIRTALKNEKANYLVLITKYRHEAKFNFSNAIDWGGMLEGLGFYLDGATGTKRGDTGEYGRGYIAPFAYMKITLVDAQTSKILGKQTIMASTTIASARAQENLASPWAALSSAEKVSAINRLIQREIGRAMPLLLKKD